MTCTVDPPTFGINYGSISIGQLSGYIAFCILLIGGASPPYGYGTKYTKYNVARKLAKRNGAITYAKAGRIYPTLYLALLILLVGGASPPVCQVGIGTVQNTM